jgi:two-component system, LytTR family, response regulator
LRVLIVDDEPLACRGVAVRLRKFPDIEIVGECGDGSSAVKQILALSPDLVFLDVQMPEMDGFDVLRALPRDRLPGIIFLTAYEQHALRAFEVHALDYLLKPINDERFEAALDRARQRSLSNSQKQLVERLLGLLGEKPSSYLSQFAVRTGSRIQVVLAEDLDWIAAAGDYSELHARGRSHLFRETMNSLEHKLDPSKFLRIHRSRIIRISRIVELRSIENREYIVKLSDGTEHRSSRTYSGKLENWLASGNR